MSDPAAVLHEHKQRLMAALGTNQAAYMKYMKLWFYQKLTRDEFDRESRKLLDATSVGLHNQFFVALLNKVDPMNQQHVRRIVVPPPLPNASSVAPPAETVNMPMPPPLTTTTTMPTIPPPTRSSVPRTPVVVRPLSVIPPSPLVFAGALSMAAKRRKRFLLNPEKRRFEQTDLFETIVVDDYREMQRAAKTPIPLQPTAAIVPPRFAAQELFLPDAGLIMGRLLIGAWEAGLSSADDAVAEMIVQAVQNLLKNIVSAVLLRRKHCRVTGAEGHFVFDIGQPHRDPTLRTTLIRRGVPVDDAPLDMHRPDKRDDVLFVSACEQVDERRPRRRVNLLDLYGTMVADRELVPVHSVAALNVERMSQMLH